jgi:hypothetical protein
VALQVTKPTRVELLLTNMAPTDRSSIWMLRDLRLVRGAGH